MGSGPVVTTSARRHGVTEADILHAYAHPLRVYEQDDGLVMLIGPGASGVLLEIGVVDGVEAPVVIHAMRARRKYLWSEEG